MYLCADTPECIMTGIYDAWANPAPNAEIELQITLEEQFSFLYEQIRVEASYEKAFKVADSIKRKLGDEIYLYIQGALCANANDKADAVFRFLQYAFRKKHYVMNDLSVPAVMRVFELNRKSRNEAHLINGFLRFEEIQPNVFFSTIGPVNDVLPLIADHFAERFNTQAFLIYDEKREKSVVYAPGTNWYFAEGALDRKAMEMKRSDQYEDLWKTFFDSTMIRERTNPICQRTHCPIHFRKYMLEFSET